MLQVNATMEAEKRPYVLAGNALLCSAALVLVVYAFITWRVKGYWFNAFLFAVASLLALFSGAVFVMEFFDQLGALGNFVQFTVFVVWAGIAIYMLDVGYRVVNVVGGKKLWRLVSMISWENDAKKESSNDQEESFDATAIEVGNLAARGKRGKLQHLARTFAKIPGVLPGVVAESSAETAATENAESKHETAHIPTVAFGVACFMFFLFLVGVFITLFRGSLGTQIVSGAALSILLLVLSPFINNVIAGWSFMATKKFHIGDMISLDSASSQTSATMGFLEGATLTHLIVRGFDTVQRLVPYSKLEDCIVSNWDARARKQIYFEVPFCLGSGVSGSSLRTFYEEVNNWVMDPGNGIDLGQYYKVRLKISGHPASGILEIIAYSKEWSYRDDMRTSLVCMLVESARNHGVFLQAQVYGTSESK